MDLGHGLGHLTYSTLVHPADDWNQATLAGSRLEWVKGQLA